MNDIEYRSLKSKAKGQMSALQTQYQKKEDKLADLQEDLSSCKSKRIRLKINEKIINLKQQLNCGDNAITFGSLALQRALTKECNKKDEEFNQEKVDELRKQWKKSRKMPLYVMGEANQHGNRFFDLKMLSQGKAIYKPSKNESCNIMFSCSKAQRETLTLLEDAVKNKLTSVSVALDDEYLYLTFDTEDLHGYGVNKKERKRSVKELRDKNSHLSKAEMTEEIKKIYKAFYDEQRQRMLVGKDRFTLTAIDMNPDGAGAVVMRYDSKTDDFTVLWAAYYDFKKLTKKLKVSSDDEEQKKQNNKRKYETALMYKHIFNVSRHYNSSMFIMEELDIKPVENSDENSQREFRRKVNNIWNRTFQSQIIQRRCAECGMELRKVNPVFSSFIGNLIFNFIDAANAAAEIGRRGYYMYTKNSGSYPFPEVSDSVIDTLVDRMIDNHSVHVGEGDSEMDCFTRQMTWGQLFQSSRNLCKDNRDFYYRLRVTEEKLPEDSFSTCSMYSRKSKVKLLLFNNLH